MTYQEFVHRITSPILWGNCLGVCIALLALGIGTLVGLSYYTHHGENISVPDLRGMSIESATAKLRSLGMDIEVADSGYVRTLPPDAVLGQEITPGTEVKTGRTIRVTINTANSPTIAMPDLADNCSLHEAQARLKAIGFKLGALEYMHGEHDWVYAIKVRGRTVAAGQRIPVNLPITIVVGDGNVDDEYNGADLLLDDENVFMDDTLYYFNH